MLSQISDPINHKWPPLHGFGRPHEFGLLFSLMYHTRLRYFPKWETYALALIFNGVPERV
jgi:hypothetical protein